MKTKLIVILCLLIVKISFGQNYRSFSADTTIWWAESKNTVEEGSLCTRQFTYLFGDTVFNALHYKKIYQSNYYYYSFAEARTDLANKWQFKGYLRDDIPNKKVYFSPSTVLGILNSEQLLYDFNLQIGDTLPHSYIYRNQHQTISGIAQKLTVSGINNITINGIAHKRYFFAGLNNQTAYITEAIGTSVGLIDPLAMSQNTYPVLTKKVMLNNWNAQDFIVLNNCTFCPSYKQFPTDSALWKFNISYDPLSNGANFLDANYQMKGDIKIGNKNYKIINRLSEYCDLQRNRYCSCSDLIFEYAIRYDSINKSVFLVSANQTVERKIYNFNLKVGKSYYFDTTGLNREFWNKQVIVTHIDIFRNELSFSISFSGQYFGSKSNQGKANVGLNCSDFIPNPFGCIGEYNTRLAEFNTADINIKTRCLNGIAEELNKKQDLILIKNKENEIEIESIDTNIDIEKIIVYDLQGRIIKNISYHLPLVSIAKPQNTILFLNIQFANGKIYTTKISTF